MIVPVMKMFRRIIRTAAALFATVLFTLNSFAAPRTSAASGILIDADTGEVLWENSADSRALIASTTKIMTAVVVLERCDLEMEFRIPPEAVGVEGSSMYLTQGECLTVSDLLYGLMLQSGNDAAVALALACCDSVPEFVALMNLKAQELDLENTHFENPSGLDSQGHYSSARDLAKLTRYALQNDAFRQIVSTRSIRLGERFLTNHNKLLWRVDGAMGVKTGYTRAAGRTLVSAAERKGRRLIAVTLHDGNDWLDHANLYDYGFARFEEQTAISAGEQVAVIPNFSGGNVPLLAGEDFIWQLSAGENLLVVPQSPKLAFGTHKKGQTAGWGAVFLGQRQLGTIKLLWGEDANEGTYPENHVRSWRRIPTRLGGDDPSGTRAG